MMHPCVAVSCSPLGIIRCCRWCSSALAVCHFSLLCAAGSYGAYGASGLGQYGGAGTYGGYGAYGGYGGAAYQEAAAAPQPQCKNETRSSSFLVRCQRPRLV